MRRIATKWFVIAGVGLVLIALAGGRVAHVWGDPGVQRTDISFCPNNTCVSITGPSGTPTLYPGAPATSLPVTFNNLTSGPIYVDRVIVKFTNSWQTNGVNSCSATNFQVSDPFVAGAATNASTDGTTTTITFPRQTIAANGSWIDNVNLAFLDTSSNQDVCAGQPLSLTYSTAAEYTIPTSTSFTESTNAGTDTATLTATVAPDIQPAAAGRAPGNGDGTVQFYECSGTTASSCTQSLGTASTWSSPGTASITMPAGSVGSYSIEAQFVPADSTSYLSSTSGIVTETLTGCVAAQTGGATTIIKAGSVYNGNLTIGNGSSVWLDGGTINGNITVGGTGEFAATGGVITGNVQSSGGPIAISGTAVSGNVQSTGGGLSLGPSTVVKGNTQIQGGGPFCSRGASPTQGQVQVRGNLQVQSLTSATVASVCSTTVGNNLLWQYNASPGLIGSCGANTVLGNLQVQYNSGQVTIGATGSGNATSGNTLVQSNTGGGTLTGNSSGGNCLLSGDKPGIVGSGNTAKGANNQCNTGSGGA
jgi:hypothetical protein